MPQVIRSRRRILCVFPAYSPSFGTFENAYALRGGVRAFMPPQGILVVAAYLPKQWEVRFIDENIRPARTRDFLWADAVFVSGMHIQRHQILDVNQRARRHGKVTVLGGPSVSSAPDSYAQFDYLHLGELGDGTDQLIAALDANSSPPGRQIRFVTMERLPLTAFPVPSYSLVELDRYFLASVQFSSGCPYRCEFCDIPVLYGRNPRFKAPGQLIAELDEIVRQSNLGAIYFVDDNFIGNRKAARELLPHLIDWQKRNGYPVQFACEATLNIAKQPELLDLMRQAYFCTIFCGIETPELDALHAMAKDHNAQMPILEAVATLNSFGMEVVSGIILGLDTDTAHTPERILDFIRRSQIPMLTINLLQALPRTPLWDRLEKEGRLVEVDGRESNVAFRLPYEDVVAMWRRCIAAAYAPEEIYRRFAYNLEHTYPYRIKPPASPARANLANIRKALRMLRNIMIRVGLLADYRATFWRMAAPLLREGKIEPVIHIGLVAHHLITFAREAVSGSQNASFYSPRPRVARVRLRRGIPARG
jgi:hopanoid C-2 methylase